MLIVTESQRREKVLKDVWQQLDKFEGNIARTVKRAILALQALQIGAWVAAVRNLTNVWSIASGLSETFASKIKCRHEWECKELFHEVVEVCELLEKTSHIANMKVQTFEDKTGKKVA